jgi:hypothetical protein
MTTSAPPEIKVSEEWIEVRFPDPVEDVDLLLREDTYTPLDNESLGFERKQRDDRTIRWVPTDKYQPTPGQELQFRLRWAEGGKHHDEEYVVRVRAEAQEQEQEQEREPQQERVPVGGYEVSSEDLRAFETACGVIVLFPEGVADEDLDVAMLVDRDRLRPSEHGWRTQRVADDAIEFLPVAAEALDPGVLRLSLRFQAEGRPRDETVQVPLAKRAERSVPPAATATSGRGGGGRSRGRRSGTRAGRGGFGAPGVTRGRGGFDFGPVLDLPLRVADSGGRRGGDDSGRDGLSALVDSIVGNALPRLGRSAGPRQFRDNLAELSARSGASTQSPYISAAAPVAAGAAGLPGEGMAISDLGSPFATLLAEADALERVGLPVIQDVRPIVDDADLDLVEARRTLTAEAATRVIEELRQQTPDGPEVAVVLGHLQTLTQQSGLLREALGIDDEANAVSPEDFANVSRFEVLEGRIAALAVALAQTDAADDPRVLIGDLKQLLGVIDENVRELVQELDLAGIGPQERATILVDPDVTGVPSITFARLEEWIREQVGRDLIYQLDRAGRVAGSVVVDTLEQQQVYVVALQGFVEAGTFPWTHPIIERVVEELDAAFVSAIAQARLVDPTGNN